MKSKYTFLSFLILLLFTTVSVKAESVSIAVAANFTGAAKKIISLFEQKTGHKARISFGSTGKLYAQIINGAPFEVFLSADNKHPEILESKDMAISSSRFVYAIGRLVLWSSKEKLFNSGEDYLKKGEFKRLGLANPKTAPYGMATIQVLDHLQILNKTKAKFIQGDSIAQTFQFIATANIEIGFIAYSQLKSWKGNTGTSWLIPLNYYQPIEQSAILLKKAKDNPAAKAFLKFLQTDQDARKIIQQFGYATKT